jgi:hypothetical protein
MKIEERSFSAPWSETTYRHEISSNLMAFYYVIRPPATDEPGADEDCPGTSWPQARWPLDTGFGPLTVRPLPVPTTDT